MKKDIYPHYVGKWKSEEMKQEARGCALSSFVFFQVIIVLLAISSLTSCTRTPKEVMVEVPVVVHDTTTTTVIQRDSIFRRDSIFYHTYVIGDTVHDVRYIEHWNTDVHELHDTLYELQYVPFEKIITETKEVPAKLTKGQHLLMALGKWMIATIVIAILAMVAYTYGIFSGRKK